MVNFYRWYKNQRLWWQDISNSPVFPSQLKRIRQGVVRALDSPSPAGERPRLEGRLPEAGGTPILLACCDEGYFYKFARQLIISAMLRDPVTRVHIHVYDPSPLGVADAEFLEHRFGNRLTISREGPERNPYAAPTAFYYAAGRFAVAAEVAERSGAPLMVIDADGVVRRGMSEAFSKLSAFDIGLHQRANKLKPWRRVLAGAVYVNATAGGLRFIADLSRAIHLNLQDRPDYHVDQTVLQYILEEYTRRNHRLSIAELGAGWIDSDFSEESLVWSAKGDLKDQFSLISLEEARSVIDPPHHPRA